MKDSKAQQDRKKFQGRKFTSICLAAALTFSLCPANVWAAQGDPAVGTETIQDIEDSAPSTEEEFSQETEEGVPQEETEETVLPEETERRPRRKKHRRILSRKKLRKRPCRKNYSNRYKRPGDFRRSRRLCHRRKQRSGRNFWFLVSQI